MDLCPLFVGKDAEDSVFVIAMYVFRYPVQEKKHGLCCCFIVVGFCGVFVCFFFVSFVCCLFVVVFLCVFVFCFVFVLLLLLFFFRGDHIC